MADLYRMLEVLSIAILITSLIRWIRYEKAVLPRKENSIAPIGNPSDLPLLRVTFYYEATENESERFISEELIPTYEKLSNVTQIRMIPYGDIVMSQNSDGVIECLPQPESCILNMQHACVVDNVPDSYITLIIIKCLMKYSRITSPNESLEKCFQEFQLPIFEKIRDCINGIKGMELLKANGVSTHAAVEIYDGPFITINDRGAAEEMVEDLFSLICKLRGNNAAIKEFCEAIV